MGQTVKARLFYGVCLDPGAEHCEYEKDENGYDSEDRKPHLLDKIAEKLGGTADDITDLYDMRKAGLEIPKALDTAIVGHDDGLRTYLVLRHASHCRYSSDIEGEVLDLIQGADDTPFREFFERVGVPYVQPKWLFGCLWF